MRSVEEILRDDLARLKERESRAWAQRRGRNGRKEGKGKATASNRESGGKRAR